MTLVPFEIRPSGRIVVEVEVNDRGPYRFAVDTAATGSFLFSRIQTELDLRTVPGVVTTVYGAVASGRYPVIDLERLTIGTETWTHPRLTALPGNTGATSGIDGVLGADFLGRYSVGFSARDRSLRLYRPDTIGARTYRDWTAVPIEPRFIGQSQEPLHFLEITIAGRSVPALLDLGAGVSVLNPPAARALELSARTADDAGRISGAVGGAPILAQLRSQTIRTGSVQWRNEIFLIADLEIFETLMSADRPLAILGSGLFTQRDFIIDFARNRLLIRASMSELE